jgi:hypothetical protein
MLVKWALSLKAFRAHQRSANFPYESTDLVGDLVDGVGPLQRPAFYNVTRFLLCALNVFGRAECSNIILPIWRHPPAKISAQ